MTHSLGVVSTALCEKTLNDIIAPLEREDRELALTRDGPSELVLPPFVRPETMQDIVKRVDEAMNQSGTQEEKEASSLRLRFLTVACRHNQRSNVDDHGPVEKGCRTDGALCLRRVEIR